MLYESALLSHIGCGRENNEDNYYLDGFYRQDINKNITEFSGLQAKNSVLAGVFDGAGGADFGETASLMAAYQLSGCQGKFSLETLKERYLPGVSHMIHDEMDKKSCTMGTTMAVLYLKNDNASVYNIGDSRIYLARDGRLLQITYDHTGDLIKYGNNSMQDTREENSKNMLVRYLGMKNEKELQPYYRENIPVRKDDVFILCSDGLYNMVSNEEILNGIKKIKEEPPSSIVKELVGAALLAGGNDNITCIVIKASGNT